MEKYGFVYIWYDRKRKMYYIGSHWGTENDGYVCSSTRMRKAYRRRPDDFKRRILKYIYSDKKDMLYEEQKWLDKAKLKKVRYYNLKFQTIGLWWSDPDYKLTVGQKISKTQTGRSLSPEWKTNIGKANKGKTISDEQKKLLSEDKKKRTYISNIELNKTMNVFHEDVEKWLLEGWYIGRLPGWSDIHTSKGKTWKRSNGNIYTNLGRKLYNNGKDMRMFSPEEVPEGWKLGRPSKRAFKRLTEEHKRNIGFSHKKRLEV